MESAQRQKQNSASKKTNGSSKRVASSGKSKSNRPNSMINLSQIRFPSNLPSLMGSEIRSPPSIAATNLGSAGVPNLAEFLTRQNLANKVAKCKEGGCDAIYAKARQQKWIDGIVGKPGKKPKYAPRTAYANELVANDPMLGLDDATTISTSAFRHSASRQRDLLLPKTVDGEDMCVQQGREIKASAGFFLHKFQYKRVAETPPSVRHEKLLGAIDQFKNFKVALNGDFRERDPSVWAAKKVAKHLLHKSALLSSRVSRVPSQILMADAQWLARKFGWRSADGKKKISTLKAPAPSPTNSSS